MLLQTKQIDNNSLGLFVGNYVSGAFLSGALQQYFASSGWVGGNVLYLTGTTGSPVQTIQGPITFVVAPTVPYSGGTGTVSSTLFTLQLVSNSITALSGFATGSFVDLSSVQVVGGSKNFTGQTFVSWPLSSGAAVPRQYVNYISGLLQSGLNGLVVPNTVNTTGDQTIMGIKTFTSSPRVPTPASSGDAVNKYYVDNVTPGFLNIVQTSGDQIISGVKTFLQSPLVPVATTANQAVPLAQLNALGTSIGGVAGFAGVLTINGTSGASGNVYLQGAGIVSVIQCGSIFYISGVNQVNSFYSASVPIPSGATGLSFIYGSPLSSKPVITQAIETTGSNVISISPTIYGSNISGFNVLLSTATPTASYFYNFQSSPVTGSGLSLYQGQQGNIGPSVNVRGIWQIGQMYNNLDVVYQQPYNASYISNTSAVSTALNAPAGTGNGQWAIFSTGVQGATGYWIYRGNYATGTIFTNGNSTFSNGSSYGYTGINAISGVSPDALTGGWTLVAQQGAVGYFVNSGVITGNFVNVSFFFNPINTGLDQGDAFISRTFQCTGFALGCRTSGYGPVSGGALLSGALYVVDLNNNKTIFQNFTMNSGVYSYVSGGFAQIVTGMYRIGIDITQTLSGIANLAVGVFGFGIS